MHRILRVELRERMLGYRGNAKWRGDVRGDIRGEGYRGNGVPGNVGRESSGIGII